MSVGKKFNTVTGQWENVLIPPKGDSISNDVFIDLGDTFSGALVLNNKIATKYKANLTGAVTVTATNLLAGRANYFSLLLKGDQAITFDLPQAHGNDGGISAPTDQTKWFIYSVTIDVDNTGTAVFSLVKLVDENIEEIV